MVEFCGEIFTASLRHTETVAQLYCDAFDNISQRYANMPYIVSSHQLLFPAILKLANRDASHRYDELPVSVKELEKDLSARLPCSAYFPPDSEILDTPGTQQPLYDIPVKEVRAKSAITGMCLSQFSLSNIVCTYRSPVVMNPVNVPISEGKGAATGFARQGLFAVFQCAVGNLSYAVMNVTGHSLSLRFVHVINFFITTQQ